MPDGTDLKRSGHRVMSPAETLERLRPHLGRMGITRLADVTGLDVVGIPVAQAVRPMGRSLSVAQGKGVDLTAALVSAAMEAAEGWHAEFATVETCKAAAGVLGGPGFPGRGMPEADRTLTFASATDLATGRGGWVPWDLVHKDYTRPREFEGAHRSTNGLASGNTLAEAKASALHELIERDAAAEFLLAPAEERRRRRIAVPEVAGLDPVLGDLVARIATAGLSLWLYDMTSDLGIPAMRAELAEVTKGREGAGPPVRRVHAGHGCHLSPVTAAIRAITEAAQSRLTDIAGSREDIPPDRYRPAESGNALSLLAHAADVLDHGYAPFAYPDESAPTVSADVARLVERLTAAGLDRVLVVDLSRDELPVRVVRAVVPGLGWLGHEGAVRGTRTGAREPS